MHRIRDDGHQFGMVARSTNMTPQSPAYWRTSPYLNFTTAQSIDAPVRQRVSTPAIKGVRTTGELRRPGTSLHYQCAGRLVSTDRDLNLDGKLASNGLTLGRVIFRRSR